MALEYPEGPTKSLMPEKGKIAPGAGLNIQQPDLITYLDFTAPMGKVSGVFFGIVFQLPKWGFERIQIEEAMDVSPVFQQYYQLTIRQKQEMEGIIKSSLASIATTLSDLELLKHDLRKYKEFMDYFRKLDFGKEKKDEKTRMEGEQSLKAVFIDQVDVHTDLPNTPIALRSIVARWPTIIADFMRLKDEDSDPEKIKKDYNVSEAEAVVLSTKNKLYVEWRDQLFRRTVEDRFKSLVQMVEARKKSYEEYKNMLKPTLVRYRQLNDAIAGAGKLGFLRRAAFWRPDAQAQSTDFVRIWAWKPFAPSEKYKASREAPLNKISYTQAGLNLEEITEIKKEKIEEIKKKTIEKGEKKTDEEIEKEADEEIRKYTLEALPMEPSIDDVIREIKKKIEDEYKVKLTTKDLLDARKKLVDKFEESATGKTTYESWLFSPYYMFYEFPIIRAVIHLPNGSEIENMMIDKFRGYTVTQNIIICRYLEAIAKDKELDNYIKQLLGEMGVGGESLKELSEEYLIKLGEEKKEEVKKPGMFGWASKTGTKINKSFGQLGINASFLRAKGKYEFAFYDRLSKYYFTETGATFNMIKDWLKAAFTVP